MKIPTIPFTICALAPLCPGEERKASAGPVMVDLYSLDEVITQLAPSLYIPVPREDCPAEGLTLRFSRMKDFTPEGIIGGNDYLKGIDNIGRFIAEAIARETSSADIARNITAEWPQAPLVIDMSDAGAATPKRREKNMIDDILSMVASTDSAPPSSPAGPRRWKARCDEIISSLLKIVYDDPSFKICEAAWRGVEFLLRRGTIKEGSGLRLQVMPVTAEGLEQDLELLVHVGSADPPNLILIDIPLDNTPRSTWLMETIISTANTLMAPTAYWITPRFLYLDTWEDLHRVQYIKHHLDDAAYAKWRKLGDMPGAEWIAVNCNRFLTRPPYGGSHSPARWSFREEEPLWISPVWALGTLVCGSMNHFGWPTRFTDYTAVTITDLALADIGTGVPVCTETTLPDDRIAEFVTAGITPLQSAGGTDRAFMPKETTLGGDSLKFRMFIDRILSFLWWCRSNMDARFGQESLDEDLIAAFDLFWQTTGQPAPDDLTVTAGTAGEDELIPLTIRMTAPRSVLPGGRTLELTYRW